ncbi:MAG: hypothetical protein ACUVWR_08515 [Anaerolineae bacterium]
MPTSMRPWVEQRFGSVAAVECQRIIKVTNIVTLEGALFNEIRSCRPFEVCESGDVWELVNKSKGDPFCKPLTDTPEDSFGRIEGEHSITASNVAKYDGFHGLVIFNEHDPLRFDEESVADYFAVALAWAQEARALDPQAVYFFLMWNCLWKSGASIMHGHAQMTLGRDMHYAKVEAWRRASLAYRHEHGTSLFDDLYEAHRDVGLAWADGGIRGMAYLAPVKEKEVILLADAYDSGLARGVFQVLDAMVREMGVRSFNLAVYMPPLASVAEDWRGFPVMVRIVDRGDVNTRVADFGAMEVYASSVVTSDPFTVAATIAARVNQQVGAALTAQ